MDTSARQILQQTTSELIKNIPLQDGLTPSLNNGLGSLQLTDSLSNQELDQSRHSHGSCIPNGAQNGRGQIFVQDHQE